MLDGCARFPHYHVIARAVGPWQSPGTMLCIEKWEKRCTMSCMGACILLWCVKNLCAVPGDCHVGGLTPSSQ